MRISPAARQMVAKAKSNSSTTQTRGTIEFLPLHPEQQRLWHQIPNRALLRAGRRFGKTRFLEQRAAKRSYQGLKVGYFTPTYKLLLPTFKRLKRQLKAVTASSSKTDMIIELGNGGLVEFWTLEDEDAGRSRDYDLVIIDEAGLMKKGLRERWEQAIAPTLLDRGGEAIMAGTPKGIDPGNYFYTAATNKDLGWVEFHVPTWSNPLLNRKEVAELPNKYPPLVYQQEFCADFVDWSGAAFFSKESLLDNGQPVEWPTLCDTVFAIIDTAVKDGKRHDGTAVTYFAFIQYDGKPRLVVLDWDIVQIEGSLLVEWLPSVYQRLEEFTQAFRVRMGSTGALIEDKASGSILLQQARRLGWAASAIDGVMTAAGKDGRAVSVSGYVHQGRVKISRHAFDKVVNFKGQTQNHFLSQICGFRIGVDNGADDLTDTFTYGISAALGNSEGI